MPLLDMPLSTARRVYETNLFAPLALVQAFAPLLVAAKGAVVNIGSIAGVIPFPWQAIYNSSKAALHHLTYSLRLELAPLGVKVTLVLLGGIDSNFMGNLPKIRLPEDSFYVSVRETIEPYLNGTGKGQTGAVGKPTAYAGKVVDGIIRQKKPQKKIWAGTGATIVWFVSTFLWYSVWVSRDFCGELVVRSLKFTLLMNIGFPLADKATDCRVAEVREESKLKFVTLT